MSEMQRPPSKSHAPCVPFRDLVRLGFARPEDAAEVFQRGVREDAEALVHHASKGPYFLSFKPGEETSDYVGRDDLTYWKSGDYEASLAKCREDDLRRAKDFIEEILEAKSWLDFGTGLGGVVHEFLALNKATKAASFPRIGVVEVQAGALAALHRHLEPKGVEIYSSVETIPDKVDEQFQLVTLFHVLEHLDEPIGILKQLRGKMEKGGKIIVEVPHAGDALISKDHHDCGDFRKFTFWKEHLILHTRASLKAFLEDAGFSNVEVKGFQRYPLANHIGWLSEGKPGGHVKRSWLRDEKTEKVYSEFLDKVDATDTIIATATA